MVGQNRADKLESPPSRGAWIEMPVNRQVKPKHGGRPPRGGRGLKSLNIGAGTYPAQSPPSRGAWIEIMPWRLSTVTVRSPPSRGAWIEIKMACGMQP